MGKRVYSVIGNRRQYRYFSLDRGQPDQELARLVHCFDGTELGQRWQPFTVSMESPHKSPWQIAPFIYCAALVCSPDSTNQVSRYVESFRELELLDQPLADKVYKVLNVCRVIDCLDPSHRIVRHDVEPVVPKPREYAFIPDRLRNSLFKIPETADSEILVAEDDANVEVSFKHFVESEKLAGIGFELLWSSD